MHIEIQTGLLTTITLTMVVMHIEIQTGRLTIITLITVVMDLKLQTGQLTTHNTDRDGVVKTKQKQNKKHVTCTQSQ